MRHRSPILGPLACALTIVASAATLSSQYSLTVNKDRLINADKEPQNWLLMNGDYGSQRYSRLTQINRDNVKDLRMVWALALGGMQDVGQNGPENEINPLIDNGFMYTSDGWGTIYKIDARQPNRGQFVWVADPGVPHEGNTSRTRGIALWEDKVLANLPDGRVIAINRDNGEIIWDKKIDDEERVRQPGAVPDGADRRRRQGARPERRRRRRHSWLGRGARRQHRQRAVALVHGAQAGRPRQRNVERRSQRLEDRRRRNLADRILRSGPEPVHLRHRQPVPDLRPAVPPRRQPLHELGCRARCGDRQDEVALPVHAE